MFAALKEHWPEYLMEAAGLAIIMVSTCAVDTLLGSRSPADYRRMRAAPGLGLRV
jgi:hypothetical protein